MVLSPAAVSGRYGETRIYVGDINCISALAYNICSFNLKHLEFAIGLQSEKANVTESLPHIFI